MAPVIGAILGAVWGGLIARRRGGNGKDIAQYAAGFAIIFAILGLFLAIFLARSATG